MLRIVTVSMIIYRHYLYRIASLSCRGESANNGFYAIRILKTINKRASIVFEKTTEARFISYG